MLLENKNAIVYGAGGIGRATALGFAAEGARVYLASRTPERLERVAEEVRAAGGTVETTVLDALDAGAVEEHAAAVAARAGSIDVSINVTSWGDVHGTPLAEMSLDDFERPILIGVRSTFLTATAAARRMTKQGSGVILMFGGQGDPMRDYFIGGTQVAFDAVDMLGRQLAAELGPSGVRVVTLRTGGIVETLPEDFEGRSRIEDGIVSQTFLGRAATLEDVGHVAAFAASERARTITASSINISCGGVL